MPVPLHPLPRNAGRPAPRGRGALLAAVAGAALSSCSTTEPTADYPASSGIGGEGVEIKDAKEHFTGNFDYDQESGRIVAKDGNRFALGEFTAGPQGMDAANFATKAYGADSFTERSAYAASGREEKAFATSASDLGGKRADTKAADRRLFRRSDMADRGFATNPYERSEDLMGMDSFEEASDAQSKDNRMSDRIISDSRDADAESDRESGILPTVGDIRALLGKDD